MERLLPIRPWGREGGRADTLPGYYEIGACADLRGCRQDLRLLPRGRMGVDLLGVGAPIAGIFTSNALYAAPLPAVLSRERIGDLGPLNPLPGVCRRRGRRVGR